MTKNTNIQTEHWSRTLTSDLSQCVGKKGLLKLVLDAVQTIDGKRFAWNPEKPSEFRPQMMMTLLTYCYSAALYGSRDIEWAIERDWTVRYICARTYPDWPVIRRFRRRNREFLQQCLVHVLKQIWALKFDEGEADYVGYEWFESELIEKVNTAAWERLDIAVLMDGVENDF